MNKNNPFYKYYIAGRTIGTMSFSALFAGLIVWGCSRLSGYLGGVDMLARAREMGGQGDYSSIVIVVAWLLCFSALSMAFTVFLSDQEVGGDG